MALASHTLGVHKNIPFLRSPLYIDGTRFQLSALGRVSRRYSGPLQFAWALLSLDRNVRSRYDARIFTWPNVLSLWRQGKGSRFHAYLFSTCVLLRRQRLMDVSIETGS